MLEFQPTGREHRGNQNTWGDFASELHTAVKQLGKRGLESLPAYIHNQRRRLWGLIGSKEWESYHRNLTNRGNVKIGTIKKAQMPLVDDAAVLADNAYSNSMEVPGFDYDWLTSPRGDTVGFAAVTDNHWGLGGKDFVISFRGTNSLLDGALDGQAKTDVITSYAGRRLPYPVEGAYGFVQRVKELEPQLSVWIREILDSIINDNCGLILVTGHSLGGACAEIFSLVLCQLLPYKGANKLRLITFEAARGPTVRSFDKIYRTRNGQLLDTQGIRISNGKDLVPDLPPQYLGFVHVGQSYYIPADVMSMYSHGKSHSISNVRERLDALRKAGYPESMIHLTTGRGKVRAGKRRTSTSSAAMKARMAYVRSFRRKY